MDKSWILTVAIVLMIVAATGCLGDDSQAAMDVDGDGVADDQDAFPYNPHQSADSDGDGYGDDSSELFGDAFPNDPNEWNDTDGDGVGDNADIYIFDDLEMSLFIYSVTETPNAVHCVVEADADGDGTYETTRTTGTIVIGLAQGMEITIIDIPDTGTSSVRFRITVYDDVTGEPLTYDSYETGAVAHVIALNADTLPLSEHWTGVGSDNLVTPYESCTMEYGVILGQSMFTPTF